MAVPDIPKPDSRAQSICDEGHDESLSDLPASGEILAPQTTPFSGEASGARIFSSQRSAYQRSNTEDKEAS